MATMSSDSYTISPSYVKYSKYLYNNKKTKTVNRKPIFAPILEEPSNIVQNLQELNTSSIPITNNNNNNSSFENSINNTYMVDYHTMNKFRPSLNLSCLPPVFEIPRKQIADNNNSNNNNINNNNMLLGNNKSIYNDKNKGNNSNKLIMKNSRLNLRPIYNNNINSKNNFNIFNNTAGGVNNNNNINNNKGNFVSLPPINSHTNYNNNYNNNLNKLNNNLNYNSNNANKANNKNSNNSTYNIRNYNQRKRQYLKPIQYKNSPNPISININETKRTIDAEKQGGGSYGKNQGKYYYNLNNRNIIKSEKLKEERALRNKEMSNISINQNKNYVDKNIVINYNNKVNNTTTNIINITNSISSIEEFVEINRDKNRVIHIPTLKIYERFDIPYKNYNSYEKYIKNWSKMIRGVLEIKAVIENTDQNCFSVIIERSKNCSLGNLLRSIGSVNEYIILSIVKQIIPLIQKYNGIMDYRINDVDEKIFNYLDVDNIWFNEQYNVVLYPGKFKHINKKENLEIFFKKIFGVNIIENNEQIHIDLMNFGISLININIFLLEISVEDLFQLIKKGDEDINNICCLFHYFCKKIQFFENFYESFKSNNSNSEFNQNYFDFLHMLTTFKINEEEKNINYIEKIMNHPFITNSSIVNENANINELIKLSKKYDFSNEYYTSNANIISFDLITRNIRKKLSNFQNFFSQHNIYDTKTLYNLYNIEIEELCRELRVNEEELHDKLLIFYENLLENKENNHY